MYPEAQKKAQAELDAFVGQDRLPEFRDQKHLVFVQAIVQEVLRWQPTTPLAMPHKTVHDDIYDGHFIPAGSIVVGNLWGILQNEDAYPNPSEFKPERFISDTGKLLPLAPESFGFGRRVCPGKYFALNSLWITIASVLASYDISKAVDPNGDTIEPEVIFSPGALSRIKPFQCKITPRRKFSA
jgi:cytochrome P450